MNDQWVVVINQRISTYFITFNDEDKASKYYDYQKELEAGAERKGYTDSIPRIIILAEIKKIRYSDKIERVRSSNKR